MRKYNKIRKQIEADSHAPMTGNNVSHSKRRTKRKFHPNLQTTHILVDGVRIRVRIRAKAIKALNKLD
jgi:large subunit ribosomal protein L28